MGIVIIDGLRNRIRWTHNNMISICDSLTEDQFTKQPGPTSPPIGWHLWHSARWSDRLRASFQSANIEGNYGDPLETENWIQDDMAQQWGLASKNLGLLQVGATMTTEYAVTVSRIGKDKLMDYAKRELNAVEESISDLDDDGLIQSRHSILPEYNSTPKEGPVFIADRKVSLFDDLLFHVTHIGRHLGVMEALKGSLFDVSGSVSI